MNLPRSNPKLVALTAWGLLLLFIAVWSAECQSPPPIPKIRFREIPRGATALLVKSFPVEENNPPAFRYPPGMNTNAFAGYGLEATHDLSNWFWYGWCNTDSNGVCYVTNYGGSMFFRVVGVSWLYAHVP